MSDTTNPTVVPLVSAGLVPRALARLIDFVLLAVVNVFLLGIVLVGALLSGLVASAVAAVLGAAVNLAYFAVMESRTGQTVGKMAMRLRVVGPTGAYPTLEQAIRRNIWVACGAAGVIPIVGGFLGGLAGLAAVLMIAIGLAEGDDSRRSAWHDRFAGGTTVVAAP